MKKDTTDVALDDSKKSIVVGILRPRATEPARRAVLNEPRHLRRFFEQVRRDGPVAACPKAGPSGYDLYRQRTARGVACQGIVPAP
jgi:hypothetical protein